MTGPVLQGGGFRVDRDGASEAIRELQDAATELRQIKYDAERMGRVVPPTADPVSRDAATLLEGRAIGGPGSVTEALQSGIEQIEELIGQLRASLDGYAHADETTAAELQ